MRYSLTQCNDGLLGNFKTMAEQPRGPFFKLDGKVAFVTGAGQGLGEAIAYRLAACGAKVGVFDLDGEKAANVALNCSGVGLQGSVTCEEDVERGLRYLEEQFGPPQIVVNNAAILGAIGPCWELEADDIRQVMDVNLIGTFLVCHAVLPGMLSRKYGRIINIASVAGKEGNADLIPYSTSKAAVIALTKSIAKSVGGKGDIVVNCISPALLDTPMWESLPKTVADSLVASVPVGRTGTIEEVAALVHYLASSESSLTTGQCYNMNGGPASD